MAVWHVDEYGVCVLIHGGWQMFSDLEKDKLEKYDYLFVVRKWLVDAIIIEGSGQI